MIPEEKLTKSGVKTSEFWTAVGAKLLGMLLVVYGMMSDQPEYSQMGAALAGLGVAGYTINRTVVKNLVHKTAENSVLLDQVIDEREETKTEE